MSDKKHIQKTLTPIILEEGMPGFEIVRDIEEKLNDPEAFNIAITGPYGSGKSTVLKSLKAHYPDGHKYLTISLASLTGENEDPNLDEKELQKIEYSILQQLIYKEKPETLPNSRFIRLKQKSLCSTIWFGVGIICFILSFLYLNRNGCGWKRYAAFLILGRQETLYLIFCALLIWCFAYSK